MINKTDFIIAVLKVNSKTLVVNITIGEQKKITMDLVKKA